MTLFALLKGNTTFKDIMSWMIFNENNQILKDLFEKEKINIPSKSTYHRMLINTDNIALEKVFRDFFFPFTLQENVAIDGKWLRGSVPQEYFLASLTACKWAVYTRET